MSLVRIDGASAAGLAKTAASGLAPAARVADSPSSSGAFSRLLAEQLQSINGQQLAADNAVQQLASGESDNIQDVVLTMAQADLTFRFALEIRNRLLDSYQELMRMQF